jgi:excisionase family DNA binding protein
MAKKSPPVELDRDWITLSQAAQYLQVHPATIMRYVRQRKIIANQLVPQGKWRVSSASIARLMESGGK